jgi:hypothetical protein
MNRKRGKSNRMNMSNTWNSSSNTKSHPNRTPVHTTNFTRKCLSGNKEVRETPKRRKKLNKKIK